VEVAVAETAKLGFALNNAPVIPTAVTRAIFKRFFILLF
jgi:hypothetical protein